MIQMILFEMQNSVFLEYEVPIVVHRKMIL